MKIAVIGLGAIGTSVLDLLRSETRLQVGWVLVSQVTPQRLELVQRLAPQAQLLTALPAQAKPDLLVECAAHAALAQHVAPALSRGISALVTSVGALSEPGMAEQLEAAALAGGTQLQLLPGAMGGIDALAAARIGGLQAVSYTGRKPPQAWTGTPAEQLCDLKSLSEAFCIFDGSAREAAQRYPRNANVAATLSIAGLGLDRTRVQLWADPAVTENVHQVQASGSFGQMELTLRGKPLAANPKTSALTVFSVVRAVLNKAAPLSI